MSVPLTPALGVQSETLFIKSKSKQYRLVVLLLAAVLLIAASGCRRNTRPNVDMGMIVPPGADKMTLPEDRTFLMASEIASPLPTYPAELLKKHIGAVTACAEIVIGVDGSVSSVTPLYSIPECPQGKSELDERFTRAVHDALLTWEYFSAAICTFPPGIPKDDDCKADGVVVTRVPIKLAYVFTFKVTNGRASVGKRRA